MAITNKYVNLELNTGNNDGTSEADAWQTLSAMAGGYAAGDVVNIKRPSSRFTSAGSISLSTSGTTSAPVVFRGYDTTIGDGGVVELGDCTLSVSGNNIRIENIDILESAANNAACFSMTGFNQSLYNCKAVRNIGSSSNLLCLSSTQGCQFTNCFAHAKMVQNASASGKNMVVWLQNSVANNCIFKMSGGGPTVGPTAIVHLESGPEHTSFIHRCIIYYDLLDQPPVNVSAIACSGTGTDCGGQYISQCTIVNCMVGIFCYEIASATVPGNYGVFNTLFSRVRTVGVITNNSTDDLLSNRWIAFNCAWDGAPGMIVPWKECRRLTDDPFTDYANADFSLNNLEGGGRVCRSAGAAWVGHPDIGAVQS